MSGARGLFDYQCEASEAKGGRRIPTHLRLAEELVSAAAVGAAGPKWTREATRLEILGWEHEERMGQRIWKKDDPERQGGFWGWYLEEVAVEMQSKIDERKGR